MTGVDFSITTAKDLVTDLNNVQVFLNCRPEGLSETVLSELADLQTDLIGQLNTVLCGIEFSTFKGSEVTNLQSKK